MRWLLGLMWPGGWVFLAAWAFQQEEVALRAAAAYAVFFCFGALGAAALLSWYFNYGRVFFVAVAAGLTVWFVEQPAAGREVQRLAAIFLLPLNFGLFAWLTERGVVTLHGIFRMGFILAQVLAVLAFAGTKAGGLEAFLRWGERPGAWTWIPLTEQLVFAAAALAVLVLVFLRRTKAEQDVLWVLVAGFAGLSHAGKPAAPFFYFGAAGVILLLGVLERGYHIAYRDELTGLPGRRALMELLPRLGRNYAIAMCDVDHFKKFNDTYGHDAGDQVLRMVAAKLSRVGGGGRTFRYGGEEFALVFRGRSAREVMPFVESLRAAVADGNFSLRGPGRLTKKPQHPPESKHKDSLTITISIGVAQHSERHSSPELVLDAADAALYGAKQAGRNCVKLDSSIANHRSSATE